jgi:hypothetical protein
MADTYVKVAGVWNTTKEIYTKVSGLWKPVNTIWENNGGTWRIVFGGNTGTIAFTTAGAFTFTVPTGVTSLSVSYPTTSGITTTALSVTAGQVLSGNIGNYGSGSTFSTITAPAYTADVATLSAVIDSELGINYGVSTGSFAVYVETNHGTLAKSHTSTPVSATTLVGNIQAILTNNLYPGSTYPTNVASQPTVANGYIASVYAVHTPNGEGTISYTVTLQQQVPFVISYNRFQGYTTAGTYSFTVPTGVYSLVSAMAVGAGGGGGGSVFSGDGHGAANGGSGGYTSGSNIAVTPGETLTITVGAGGTGVGSGTGGTGGTSTIARGATVLYTATGGVGGNGVFGDNAPAAGGAGGSPSGVAGSYNASWMVIRNTPGQGYNGAGQNGTGYGNGGLGGNCNGGAALGGTGLVGGAGAVTLTW